MQPTAWTYVLHSLQLAPIISQFVLQRMPQREAYVPSQLVWQSLRKRWEKDHEGENELAVIESSDKQLFDGRKHC